MYIYVRTKHEQSKEIIRNLAIYFGSKDIARLTSRSILSMWRNQGRANADVTCVGRENDGDVTARITGHKRRDILLFQYLWWIYPQYLSKYQLKTSLKPSIVRILNDFAVFSVVCCIYTFLMQQVVVVSSAVFDEIREWTRTFWNAQPETRRFTACVIHLSLSKLLLRLSESLSSPIKHFSVHLHGVIFMSTRT